MHTEPLVSEASMPYGGAFVSKGAGNLTKNIDINFGPKRLSHSKGKFSAILWLKTIILAERREKYSVVNILR